MKKLSEEDKKYLQEIEELIFHEQEEVPKTFIDFANKKYADEIKYFFLSHKFTVWDDYALYLYYVKFNENKEAYYSRLEDDLKEYSDLETRDIEEKYDGKFYLCDRGPEKW